MGEIFHAFVTRHFSAMSSTSSAAVFLISDWTFLLTERRHHSPHRFSFFCLWLGNNCLNENSAKQMCLISQSLNFAFLSKKPQDVIVWLHFYHSTLLARNYSWVQSLSAVWPFHANKFNHPSPIRQTPTGTQTRTLTARQFSFEWSFDIFFFW